MISRETTSRVAVMGGAAIDKVTPDGVASVITPEVINQTIICGISFSGWVTLSLGVGAIVVAVSGVIRLCREVRSLFRRGRVNYEEED